MHLPTTQGQAALLGLNMKLHDPILMFIIRCGRGEGEVDGVSREWPGTEAGVGKANHLGRNRDIAARSGRIDQAEGSVSRAVSVIQE